MQARSLKNARFKSTCQRCVFRLKILGHDRGEIAPMSQRKQAQGYASGVNQESAANLDIGGLLDEQPT
jgi:hypothetical protein